MSIFEIFGILWQGTKYRCLNTDDLESFCSTCEKKINSTFTSERFKQLYEMNMTHCRAIIDELAYIRANLFKYEVISDGENHESVTGLKALSMNLKKAQFIRDKYVTKENMLMKQKRRYCCNNWNPLVIQHDLDDQQESLMDDLLQMKLPKKYIEAKSIGNQTERLLEDKPLKDKATSGAINLRGLIFTDHEIKECRRKNGLLRLGIELSRKCNLRCRYCSTSAGDPLQNELNIDDVKSVIKQAKDLGAKTIVVIGGGEPLLYPNLWDVLTFINNNNMIPVLFTNCTDLDKEKVQKLWEYNASVIGKINSINYQTQDDLSGLKPGTLILKKMIEGIKLLMEQGFNTTQPSQMGVETIICNQNIKDIPKIWRWCRKNNIFPYVELMQNIGRARSAKELQISPEEARDIFEKICGLDKNDFGHEWIPHPPYIGWNCQQNFFSCYIDAVGNIQPCSGAQVYYGNIRDSSLKQILDSEDFLKIRRIPERLMGKCSTCQLNNQCYGCRGNAYDHTGDFFSEDPMCWF